MRFRPVLFYRPNGETPSFFATVRSRFPPTVDPYVRSCHSFVDLNTSVLIPRSLSQCSLLGVRDAGGWLRLAESEANRPARRDKSANASDPSQPGGREVCLLEPYGARFWDAYEGSGQPLVD